MVALEFLTGLAIVILLGLLCALIAKRIGISEILLMVVVGLLLNKLEYAGKPLFDFPLEFVAVIGFVSLVMIIFDGASQFSLREATKLSEPAARMVFLFMFLTFALLTPLVFFIYDTSWTYAFLFTAIMVGTGPDLVISLFGKTRNKIAELLELESIINTPLTVLLPFIILDFARNVQQSTLFENVLEQSVPFLQQIITGLGAGLLFGIIIAKALQKYYHDVYSPLTVITVALLTFVTAENIGGNGVIAVTVLGFIFGYVDIKKKFKLFEYSSLLSNIFKIMIFVFLGLLIDIPLDLHFIGLSLAVFAAYIGIRFIAVYISVRKWYDLGQITFISLNAAKGVPNAVVIMLLLTMALPNFTMISDLMLAFVLYSIFTATIAMLLAKPLLGTADVSKD